MKKLLIVLCLLLCLCGCEEDGKQMANPDDRYLYIIEMINEHENFQEVSNYFDIGTEMAKIENPVMPGVYKSFFGPAPPFLLVVVLLLVM